MESHVVEEATVVDYSRALGYDGVHDAEWPEYVLGRCARGELAGKQQAANLELAFAPLPPRRGLAEMEEGGIATTGACGGGRTCAVAASSLAASAGEPARWLAEDTTAESASGFGDELDRALDSVVFEEPLPGGFGVVGQV